MALSKALQFVKKFISESTFRSEIHQVDARELESKFDFNEVEFDDAINMQLVKCQTAEQAELYQQLRMYYKLLKAHEVSSTRKS